MSLEHTKNKYYGDHAKRPANVITERKADLGVLARAERAKAALRANNVMGGLQSANQGARVSAPAKRATKKIAAKPVTKKSTTSGVNDAVSKAWGKQMRRNKSFTSNTERDDFKRGPSQKPWRED